MFNLQKQIAKITKVNQRTENHGDKSVLAVDVSLSITMGNRILDTMSDALRLLLFRPAQKDEQLNLLDPDTPLLNFPRLGAVPWEEDFPGYLVTLETGAELAQPTVQKMTLRKIRVRGHEGGSVTISLLATCTPEPSLLASLGELQQHSSVVLSLAPPEREEVEADDDENEETIEPDPDQEQLPIGGEGDTLEQQEQVERDRLAGLGQAAAA